MHIKKNTFLNFSHFKSCFFLLNTKAYVQDVQFIVDLHPLTLEPFMTTKKANKNYKKKRKYRKNRKYRNKQKVQKYRMNRKYTQYRLNREYRK